MLGLSLSFGRHRSTYHLYPRMKLDQQPFDHKGLTSSGSFLLPYTGSSTPSSLLFLRHSWICTKSFPTGLPSAWNLFLWGRLAFLQSATPRESLLWSLGASLLTFAVLCVRLLDSSPAVLDCLLRDDVCCRRAAPCLPCVCLVYTCWDRVDPSLRLADG